MSNFLFILGVCIIIITLSINKGIEAAAYMLGIFLIVWGAITSDSW